MAESNVYDSTCVRSCSIGSPLACTTNIHGRTHTPLVVLAVFLSSKFLHCSFILLSRKTNTPIQKYIRRKANVLKWNVCLPGKGDTGKELHDRRVSLCNRCHGATHTRAAERSCYRRHRPGLLRSEFLVSLWQCLKYRHCGQRLRKR